MRIVMLLLVFLVLCVTPPVAAQGECPAFVSTALETVGETCSGTARNELCYGNLTVQVTPRAERAGLQFEQPGDMVSLVDVAAVQLSPFSVTSQEWGVALLKLQANLPETLPGQNVTMLLLGEVRLTAAEDQRVELPVTASGGVNVRALPSTNAAVLGSLRAGQAVTAIGRLPDGSWIRIRLDDATVGWVSADFLMGEVQRLLPDEPGAPAFGSMQAFYFTTGLADAPCQAAPTSGILIQTPEGAGIVRLRANNVDIALGSTVYLQAMPGDTMYVSVITGHARLTAFGADQLVPAGTVAAVPLDASGVAYGPPGYPTTYDRAALLALPLNAALPAPVSVEPGIAEEAIPAAIDVANGLPPDGGRWAHVNRTTHIPAAVCGLADDFVLGSVSTQYTTIAFNADRSTLTLRDLRHEVGGVGDWSSVTLYRTGEASYAGHYFSGDWQLVFTSPTSYAGSIVGWPGNPECSWDQLISGEYRP